MPIVCPGLTKVNILIYKLLHLRNQKADSQVLSERSIPNTFKFADKKIQKIYVLQKQTIAQKKSTENKFEKKSFGPNLGRNCFLRCPKLLATESKSKFSIERVLNR